MDFFQKNILLFYRVKNADWSDWQATDVSNCIYFWTGTIESDTSDICLPAWRPLMTQLILQPTAITFDIFKTLCGQLCKGKVVVKTVIGFCVGKVKSLSYVPGFQFSILISLLIRRLFSISVTIPTFEQEWKIFYSGNFSLKNCTTFMIISYFF